MKKLIIGLAAVAAVAVGMVSCNNKDGQYQIVVEPNGEEAAVWAPGEAIASWDNTLVATEVYVSDEVVDGRATLQMPEGLQTDGARCFAYPAAAYAGEGKVSIPTVQNGVDYKQLMPYMAQSAEGAGALRFMSLCGLVCLHITTAEQLSGVSVSTDDTLAFLSGLFGVEGYPQVSLVAEEGMGGVKSVRCEDLSQIDFSQGADVVFYVAPGKYKTITVTMTTADGRVCVKHQKEDMVVEVNRNNVATIIMGAGENVLAFE